MLIFCVTKRTAWLLPAALLLFSGCKQPHPSDAEALGLPPEYYRYKYPSKMSVYLDGKALGRCLGQELKRHPFTWGVDRKKYSIWNFDSYLTGSKYAYYTTPTELVLKKWILSQPDNSITPASLFTQALEFNNRNVVDSLVNIHTILRNVARWRSPYVKAQNAPSTPTQAEDVTAFFNKMIDIRGDLMERGGSNKGDHPGSWYRMWGMMLKFIMSAPVGEKNVTYQNPWFNFNRDYLRALVAGLAENIKHILPGFADDPDKHRKGDLNARAANGAYWMAMTALNHPETLKRHHCSPNAYLTHNSAPDQSK